MTVTQHPFPIWRAACDGAILFGLLVVILASLSWRGGAFDCGRYRGVWCSTW